jgi:hypothetical protein
MKNSKSILLGAVLLTGVFAMAAPASADYYRHADFRNDRRELYQDRRELGRDRAELYRDRRNGASRAEIANDRREIWQDRREVSQDRRELRNDRSWWHW